MIDLTPLDVRKKKDDLPRVLRGYDVGRVDDFLELVADRLEQLVRENRRQVERIHTLEQSLNEYRDRESSLTEALMAAQEMREELTRQATRDADLIRREAELKAHELRSSAKELRGREMEMLRRAQARRTQFFKSFRSMLERELAELVVMEESLRQVAALDEPEDEPVAAREPVESLEGEETAAASAPPTAEAAPVEAESLEPAVPEEEPLAADPAAADPVPAEEPEEVTSAEAWDLPEAEDDFERLDAFEPQGSFGPAGASGSEAPEPPAADEVASLGDFGPIDAPEPRSQEEESPAADAPDLDEMLRSWEPSATESADAGEEPESGPGPRAGDIFELEDELPAGPGGTAEGTPAAASEPGSGERAPEPAKEERPSAAESGDDDEPEWLRSILEEAEEEEGGR